MKSAITTLFIISLLSSCASTYNTPVLQKMPYTSAAQGEIEISYAHNLQYISRNRWYSKKEKKHGMIALAVKVTNNTSEAIELTPLNLRVYGPNGVARKLFTPEGYGEKVRQRIGLHFLHALYGPWITITEQDRSGNIDVRVLYLPVGAAIGIRNAVRASKANRINVELLNSNAIWSRVVGPNETVYGTLLMAGSHNEELVFRYIP